MTQDGPNIFSGHRPKTVMSCKNESTAWRCCPQLVFDSCVVAVILKVEITVDLWNTSRWKYNFNKAIQAISASFRSPLTSKLSSKHKLLRLNDVSAVVEVPTRCGVHLLRNAITVHHQGYRDVWRPKELWLTRTRWCFVFSQHTFPVPVASVDRGDTCSRLKKGYLIFLFVVMLLLFCYLAKPLPAWIFSSLQLSLSVNKWVRSCKHGYFRRRNKHNTDWKCTTHHLVLWHSQ